MEVWKHPLDSKVRGASPEEDRQTSADLGAIASMPRQELQPDVYCFAAVSYYRCPLKALVLGTIFQTEI